jgi:hypothetical protein
LKNFSSSPTISTEVKNWNEIFQNIVSLPEVTKADKTTKLIRYQNFFFLKKEKKIFFSSLQNLCSEFSNLASTIGRTIISEVGLANHLKTIKPIDVGGVAGGEKYIVAGIFFKFSKDFHNIYGSDEMAMKASNNELNGIRSYYSWISLQNPLTCKLRVPLSALIDFRGWRLSAISILPIGKDTLKYGSGDGALTVKAEIPELNKIMLEAGNFLGKKKNIHFKNFFKINFFFYIFILLFNTKYSFK